MEIKAVLVALVGIGIASLGAYGGEAKPFELKTIRNVAYYEGKDADPIRHKLDIHVPVGVKDFPVVFLVHGGGWTHGNKDHFGIYTQVAKMLTRNGIGVVCPNYRLSPGVKHPEHIRDVARAFAWTHKNIAKYGGDPEELFVSGHSAGGHLCALLATDESYLKEHGLTLKNIRGAMPISGLYIIPNQKLFDLAFGKEPETKKKASPISHVRADLPPFLVLFGDNDLPTCDRPGAEKFCKALEEKMCSGQLCEIGKRNHMSIMWNAAHDTDPVAHALLSFIMVRVTIDRCDKHGMRALEEFSDFVGRYVERVAGEERK